MTAETTFRGFKIRAEYLGNKACEGMPENWNNHRVYLSKNGRRCSFEFWASIANPEVRSPSDLRGAFECFLSDATAGEQSFEEFCRDFGYDTDSRNAERVHKACVRSAVKARRLLNGDDIYALSNALSDAS
jgi:hypothetical protein